jgi:enamine deaminase RidA (YjgF/YER057c/UK114 family)
MKDSFSAPTGARASATPQDKVDAIERKLLEKLIKLPLIPKPLGEYLPINKVGNLVYVSGQLPIKDGSLGSFLGRLGKEITLEAGQRAAQWCTFNALAHLKRDLGSLEKIKRVVKLTGYVAGMPGFTQQAEVLNGASKILIELFGESGRHARVAVGVTDLPKGACVEIEYIFEVE